MNFNAPKVRKPRKNQGFCDDVDLVDMVENELINKGIPNFINVSRTHSYQQITVDTVFF